MNLAHENLSDVFQTFERSLLSIDMSVCVMLSTSYPNTNSDSLNLRGTTKTQNSLSQKQVPRSLTFFVAHEVSMEQCHLGIIC